MSKSTQNKSLIQRLYKLFFVIMGITLSTAVIFYLLSYLSLRREKLHYMESITDNLIQNTEEMASSVTLMSETVSNTMYTQYFLTETYIPQKLKYQEQMNRLMNRLINSSSHLSNMLLIDTNNTVYSFSSFDYLLASKLDNQYDIFSMEHYPDGFTGALFLEETDSSYYVSVQTIYENNVYDASKIIGRCIIICNSDSLTRLCTNAATSNDSLFAILDGQREVIASNQSRKDAYDMLDTITDKDYLVMEHKTVSDWTLYSAVPYKELYAELMPIRYMAALFIMTLICSFVILARHMNKGIIKPLLRIVAFLQKDPYYALHNELEASGDNEITTLSTNINRMLEEINALTHTVLQNQAHMYEIELSENQAKLFALRTQINPHFLYNTLNSIQGLTYEGKCTEINNTVAALSYLMRYSLNKDNMTSIKEEFHCIEKYLQIVEVRYPNRFKVQLQLDADASEYRMPRFLLQPLVENAISHGLIPSNREGHLTLSAQIIDCENSIGQMEQTENICKEFSDSAMPEEKTKNETSDTAILRCTKIIHIECIDNGIGITPDKLEELRSNLKNATTISGAKSEERSEIGLQNIHMRIKLLYGSEYGLRIFSSELGTKICVDFPDCLPDRVE